MLVLYAFLGLFYGTIACLIFYPLSLYFLLILLIPFRGGHKILFNMPRLRTMVRVSIWLGTLQALIVVIVGFIQQSQQTAGLGVGCAVAGVALIFAWPRVAELMGWER